jgi:predicted metal-dependent phosphoesterase TrpH
MARREGVGTLAFCDHMDIRAASLGLDLAREAGIELFTGVELSTSRDGREHHLLCYGFDPGSRLVRDFIEESCERIWGLVPEVIEAICSMGFRLDRRDFRGWGRSVPTGVSFLDALLECNPGDPRLHRYTTGDRSGSPYLNFYQDFSRLDFARAVVSGLPDLEETIRYFSGEGILVLAHPGHADETVLGELKRCGLDGIEVYSTHHSQSDTRWLAGIAGSLGLLRSAGSDFHGERIKPGIALGRVSGEPDQGLLDAIRARMYSWQ